MTTDTPPGADPAVKVAKIGYIGFQTPDVARLTEYYEKVMGFAVVEESPSQVFLTTGADHHSVVIDKAETAVGRSFVGWEVHGTLDEAQQRLHDLGFDVERRSDIAPGTPDVLVLEEPLSGVPLHLYEAQADSGVTPTFDQRPNKLGHVAAWTSNLGPIQSFYEDALGFRWSDTVGDFFIFLRCNVDHHAANFMVSDRARGMHHVAYEARDLTHLQIMLDTLARNGHRLHWGPGRHGPGHNIFTYHDDPDGNQIELFTQLDVIYDEEKGYFEPRPWHEDSPQYPKTWEVDLASMNSWGTTAEEGKGPFPAP
jgi:catechol-2,3-dioxygenase